jgi:hypothetical protein
VAGIAGFRCNGLESLQSARGESIRAKPPAPVVVEDLFRWELVNI